MYDPDDSKWICRVEAMAAEVRQMIAAARRAEQRYYVVHYDRTHRPHRFGRDTSERTIRNWIKKGLLKAETCPECTGNRHLTCTRKALRSALIQATIRAHDGRKQNLRDHELQVLCPGWRPGMTLVGRPQKGPFPMFRIHGQGPLIEGRPRAAPQKRRRGRP
jgi:hypothetical protein